MVSSRSQQMFSFYLLLELSVFLVHGQTLDRIAESSQPDGTDYTGEIRQFSEIGPGGYGTTPRPWICYTGNTDNVVWQGPGGRGIPTETERQATGSELFMSDIGGFGVALYRGPDYNSPDGEYCCVGTATNERRCVILTVCPTLHTQGRGIVTYHDNTSNIFFNCSHGYRLSGFSPITCDESTMQWSPAQSSCESIKCPILPNPTNGRVTLTGIDFKDTATYSCESDYTLTGSATRVCGADREWTLTAPNCQVIDQATVQLKFGPTDYCLHWSVDKVSLMRRVLREAIQEAVLTMGNHTLPLEHISEGVFSCYGCKNHTTYRTTITGTDTLSADKAVHHLGKWVEGGAATQVQWYLVYFDLTCPVRISSVSERECGGDEATQRCVDICVARGSN